METRQTRGEKKESFSEALSSRYVKTFSGLFKKEMNDRKRKALVFSMEQFILSRNRRVKDLLSKESKEAMEIEQSLYPMGNPFSMLCVDGRVIAKLVSSAHGSAMRTPAGDSAEFLPNKDGTSLYLSQGKFASYLANLFNRQNHISWVLDSHLYCAARKTAVADSFGVVRSDDGLFEDVERKKKIAEALRSFVSLTFGGTKSIDIIHSSFDPHSGYIFMGLEKDEVMSDARVLKNGLNVEILEELAEEKKIIFTRSWVEKGGILHDIFSKHSFDIRYDTEYRKGTNQFWTNMRSFSDEVLPLAEKKIIGVYPELRSNKDALRQRAVFLTANAYTAFLYGSSPNGYPYADHDESIIVVTYGDRGPYDRMRSFTVDPNNRNISYVIKFVQGLVRGNRAATRYSDKERQMLSEVYGKRMQEFVWSPVPVGFFEHLTAPVSTSVIAAIRSTDWSDIAQLDWMEMSSEDFFRYIDKKIPGFPAVAAQRIEILRQHAIKTYLPGLPATNDFLEGRLMPIWMLRDVDRSIIAAFPFLTKGYSYGFEKRRED